MPLDTSMPQADVSPMKWKIGPRLREIVKRMLLPVPTRIPPEPPAERPPAVEQRLLSPEDKP